MEGIAATKLKHRLLTPILRRLLEELGLEVVDACAYQTDETFGYEYWRADQFSCGRGTHEAIILIGQPVERK